MNLTELIISPLVKAFLNAGGDIKKAILMTSKDKGELKFGNYAIKVKSSPLCPPDKIYLIDEETVEEDEWMVALHTFVDHGQRHRRA